MRRIWLALLLALCCLLCMACASGETKQLVTADGLTQEAAVNTQQPVVLYSFETKSVEKEYRAEDGTLMATAHYALPVLTASNAAGNKLETETITVRCRTTSSSCAVRRSCILNHPTSRAVSVSVKRSAFRRQKDRHTF